MRRNITVCILAVILGLALISPALADDKSFEGEVSVGGTISDVDGNEAKANEYQQPKGSGFNYGSTNLLENCPASILILAEND